MPLKLYCSSGMLLPHIITKDMCYKINMKKLLSPKDYSIGVV
jgi:hypothetical protein